MAVAYAVDGQWWTAPSVPAATQAAYAATYGAQAGVQWAHDHNVRLGFTTNPNEVFNTPSGPFTITQLGVLLARDGYTGPWDRGSLLVAVTAQHGWVTRASEALQQAAPPISPLKLASEPTDRAGAAVATAAGWLQESTTLGGQAVPNWALAGAGGFGVYLVARGRLGPRRRRRFL